MTTTRHIKSVYRIVNDEMLLYAGPLEIPVNGSTEVKEGDLVISFSSPSGSTGPVGRAGGMATQPGIERRSTT